jgi:hypothetical protein
MDLASLTFSDIETFIIRAMLLAALVIGAYRFLKNEWRR